MFAPDLTVQEARAAFATLTVLETESAGGQGAVFRADHPVHGECALKVYTPESRLRVDAEVELLAGIQHPSVIEILESGTAVVRNDHSPYIIMPFIHGSTLRVRLEQGDVLGEADARALLGQLGSAIQAVWDVLRVHRDIKPDNILIDACGRAVLIDFGVTRHLELPTMTDIGGAPGTVGYKSPEQSAGVRTLSYKSDLFSVGVTVYEGMSGRHPFAGRQDLIDAGMIPPPLGVADGCSPEFSTLLSDLMATRPVMRPFIADVIARAG
jgi:serine/threonine-protein kinase